MSMLAVVKYARREGLLLSIDRYTEDEGPIASERMSVLEEVNTDDNIEIVMLCADSEQTMAITHGKYFSDKAMRNIRAQEALLNTQQN